MPDFNPVIDWREGNPDWSSLGKRVKWARTLGLNKMSQTLLADNANLSQSFITKLERNPQETPRDENIAKLSQALGVNFKWLSEGNGEPYQFLGTNAEKQKEEIINYIRQLPDIENYPWDMLLHAVKNSARCIQIREIKGEFSQNSIFTSQFTHELENLDKYKEFF